jgi:hypothetical protein
MKTKRIYYTALYTTENRIVDVYKDELDNLKDKDGNIYAKSALDFSVSINQ